MLADNTAPTHCASHRLNENSGTATCTGHRGACASNDAVSWAAASGKIYAGDVDALRQALRREIDAYKANYLYSSITKYLPNTISPGNEIYHSDINSLSSMVDQMYGISETTNNPSGGLEYVTITDTSSDTFNKQAGDKIVGSEWQTLIDKYNTLRQNCICNSDCSCNNVCACYGDCGCNYSSDIRLKENIEFIKVENGLNVYSWNYIWNTTKRFVGVMAQELLNTKYAFAVTKDNQGYYMVDYSRLPLKNILGEKYASNRL
jgi:hypothetical protein